MRSRVAPWIASLAAHVAVLAVLRTEDARDPVPAPEAEAIHDPTVVELIDLTPVPGAIVAPSGGVPLPPRASVAAPSRPRPARRPHRPPGPRIEPTPPAAADPPATAPPAEGSAAGGPAGNLAPPGPGPDVEAPREVPIASVARPTAASQARPRSPRLISASAVPAGTGSAPADQLFVAILTVDTDGRVIGVKFKRGPIGYRTDRAMAAAWQFHYHPALDGDGHPIVSQVEQRFVVE